MKISKGTGYLSTRKAGFSTIVAGSLDELRVAMNHCRLNHVPVSFVLTDPNELPTALNILKDAEIEAVATVSILLEAKQNNVVNETPDPFFATDDEIAEATDDPDIKEIAEAVKNEMPREVSRPGNPNHPVKRRGRTFTPEQRRQCAAAMKVRMKKYWAERRK